MRLCVCQGVNSQRQHACFLASPHFDLYICTYTYYVLYDKIDLIITKNMYGMNPVNAKHRGIQRYFGAAWEEENIKLRTSFRSGCGE